MQNLSTKEVNYIKDLMSFELVSCKKSFQYANQESDPSFQRIFFDTARMHQQNYLSLLGYVDEIIKRQGGHTH